ncbi:MAG: Rab family GTPase [Chloroflexota bacterium]
MVQQTNQSDVTEDVSDSITESKPEIRQKICILGDFSVGKTSLVKRFVENRFDDKYLSTIGAKISRKKVETDRTAFDFYIWDLAGGEAFQHVTKSYISGATGAVIACDLTRVETIKAMIVYTQLLQEMDPDIEIIFVGNKSDLIDERAISESEISEISTLFGIPFYLTSAKTGENVNYLFSQMALNLAGKL